jgi:hypothetical protein
LYTAIGCALKDAAFEMPEDLQLKLLVEEVWV